VGLVELGRTAGAKEARVGILAPEPAWSQSCFRASPIGPGVQADIDAAPTAHWQRSHLRRVYTRRYISGPGRTCYADGGNQRRTGTKLCHDDPRLDSLSAPRWPRAHHHHSKARPTRPTD